MVSCRFNSNESLREGSLREGSLREGSLSSLREGSTAPIKKSPREFIIPISVEGGGLIKPSTSSSTSTPTETPKKSPFEDKFEHAFYNSGFRNNNLMRFVFCVFKSCLKVYMSQISGLGFRISVEMIVNLRVQMRRTTVLKY